MAFNPQLVQSQLIYSRQRELEESHRWYSGADKDPSQGTTLTHAQLPNFQTRLLPLSPAPALLQSSTLAEGASSTSRGSAGFNSGWKY